MIEDLQPDAEGFLEREDGFRVHYQRFGDHPETVLLLPTWSIVHSDFWRRQVPHLLDRYTVVAFDGLGNGGSDRPLKPGAYAERLTADDAIAVLDDLGIERAAILSASQGGCWGLVAAASNPGRVTAAVFIAPDLPFGPSFPEQEAAFEIFDDPRNRYLGWGKWNRNHWREDWDDFLRFFFSKCFTEPDSVAEIEHFLGMGRETRPEVIAATIDAVGLSENEAEAMARSLRLPVLVIHGQDDEITPLRRSHELTRLAPDAELIEIPGSGHEPHCRNPEIVNPMIDDFLSRHHPH